jgi:hypothetical protein
VNPGLGSVFARNKSGSTTVRRWKTWLTAGPIHQRNREGGAQPLRPPGPAHVNAKERGENGLLGSAAQNKEGEGQEGAGRRGAGL